MNKSIGSKLSLAFAFAILLVSGAWFFSTGAEKAPIPEYVGSQACLGCHADRYSSWKASNHATMVVPIINTNNLPKDISTAPENLQKELQKATFIVARSMFMARDPESQHYKTLGVMYNEQTKAYAPGFSFDWSTQCAGCHVTNMDTPKLTWSEPGISCESCHGPGREHVLGKGDKTKIVRSKAGDICGQCHGGNDRQTGGHLMADGTNWVVGYRPGMQLSEIKGLQLTPVDPAKLPPDANVNVNHLRNYNMWLVSGHGHAMETVSKGMAASNPECYSCHTAEGFKAKLAGQKVDVTKKDSFSTITCIVCHDPHNSPNHRQLVMNAEKLCVTCHFQQAPLTGDGAVGIEKTVGEHSDLACVGCHMTEANHLMKIIRPDDPALAQNRKDTCSTCHKKSDKQTLGAKLREWQSSYTTKMGPLQADLKTLDGTFKNKPDLLNAGLKSKYDAVKKNLALLEGDGSRGAHNIEYAVKILDRARTDLDEIKSALK